MTEPKKKQRKTAAQRAQEAYDVQVRIANRLIDQEKRAKHEHDRIRIERDAAIARRDYLAKHPDLPKQKQDPTSTTTSTPPGGTTA